MGKRAKSWSVAGVLTSRGVLAAVGAAVVLAAMPTAALAQGGGGGGPGMRGGMRGGGGFGGMMGMGGGRDMMPPITTQNLERYSSMLSLSDDQKQAATLLHEAYLEQVRQVQDEMRQKAEQARNEFRDTQDPSVFQSLRPAMQQATTRRRELDASFMNDVRSLLTEDQATKWPGVERAQRRDQGMRRGFLSGERVDLTRLVEEAAITPEAVQQLESVIESYELELDRELTARNSAQERIFQQMGEMFQGGDIEGMEKLVDEGRELSVRVRDVNRKYARQIMDLLPEADRPAFEERFRRASFPDVYRQMQAERAIAAAMAFEDLEPQQADDLQALNERLSRESTALRTQMAAAVEESEMNFSMAGMFQRGGQGQGAMGELRTQRRDLDRTTMEALRRILTEAQVERLPQQDEERGGDAGPGRMRGEGGRRGQT